jgi:hypothetical protein
MNRMRKSLVPLARCWHPLCLAIALAIAGPSPVRAQDAASLLKRHATLLGALESSPFQRPLVLESIEHADRLQGDIYSRIDQPLAVVGPALRGIKPWCDILILHLNVKQCSTSGALAGAKLGLAIGSKHDQPLSAAYRIEFDYRLVTAQSDYLQVLFQADQGPWGTSGYRIRVEAVALDAERSFLHLSYSSAYGVLARIAMQGYLATIGRGKVGFSIVGRKPDGQPQHIGGTRGVVERNTMRYYLAVESYLGALSLPVAQQFEKRLAAWFAGTERHPAQLHEVERSEYLALKRGQMRQQAPGG